MNVFMMSLGGGPTLDSISPPGTETAAPLPPTGAERAQFESALDSIVAIHPAHVPIQEFSVGDVAKPQVVAESAVESYECVACVFPGASVNFAGSSEPSQIPQIDVDEAVRDSHPQGVPLDSLRHVVPKTGLRLHEVRDLPEVVADTGPASRVVASRTARLGRPEHIRSVATALRNVHGPDKETAPSQVGAGSGVGIVAAETDSRQRDARDPRVVVSLTDTTQVAAAAHDAELTDRLRPRGNEAPTGPVIEDDRAGDFRPQRIAVVRKPGQSRLDLEQRADGVRHPAPRPWFEDAGIHFGRASEHRLPGSADVPPSAHVQHPDPTEVSGSVETASVRGADAVAPTERTPGSASAPAETPERRGLDTVLASRPSKPRNNVVGPSAIRTSPEYAGPMPVAAQDGSSELLPPDRPLVAQVTGETETSAGAAATRTDLVADRSGADAPDIRPTPGQFPAIRSENRQSVPQRDINSGVLAPRSPVDVAHPIGASDHVTSGHEADDVPPINSARTDSRDLATPVVALRSIRQRPHLVQPGSALPPIAVREIAVPASESLRLHVADVASAAEESARPISTGATTTTAMESGLRGRAARTFSVRDGQVERHLDPAVNSPEVRAVDDPDVRRRVADERGSAVVGPLSRSRGRSFVAPAVTSVLPMEATRLQRDGGPVSTTQGADGITEVSSLAASSVLSTAVPARGRGAVESGHVASDAVAIESLVDEATTQTIKQARQLAGNNVTELEVEIDPPELGRLLIRLSRQQGELSARITVSEAATLELVHQELQDLRDNLSQAGINVARVDVDQRGQQSSYRDSSHDHRPGEPAGEKKDTDPQAPPNQEDYTVDVRA